MCDRTESRGKDAETIDAPQAPGTRSDGTEPLIEDPPPDKPGYQGATLDESWGVPGGTSAR